TTSSSLPDSHTWPTFPVQPPPPSATIPVVDLGRPPHAVASAVRKASDEWGVFQVTNHGIPTTLLREAEFEARRLFALPAEEKLAVVRSPDGIDGYGLARISRFFCQANVVRRVYDHGFACKACESPLAERLRQFLRLHGLLLRHATGGEDIATNEAGRRGPSTALPACDVERVP
ncbi:unnamed protein product, partial [Linum tenue]